MEQLNRENSGMGRILIVEDSATQAEQLKGILDRNGYLHQAARNGREAVELMRAGQPPSLVISDIVMPEMDGYQLCRHIKDDERLRNTPVILLTSLTDPVDVMRGLECGADNFIFKPYEERYLLARIAFMLANWSLRQAEPAQMGIEITFSGQRYFITSDRMQILNLLLSTYEAAVEKNRELASTAAKLEAANAQLGREISERKKMELAANAAKEEAERANTAKSDFMSHMSHELRTPLNAILGFGQLLQLRSSDATTLESADLILKAGRHLLTLINEVLDLAKIEAGKLTLSIEPVSLGSAIAQAIEIVDPIARARSVSIEASTQDCHSLYVMADRQRLVQVFLNLLTNAAKYNHPEGRILVRCRQGEEFHSVEVLDTGPGISEEGLALLFKPFERLGNQTEEGTGMGLALSRLLMSLMEGELSLVSTSPEGSCFGLRLRVAEAPAELKNSSDQSEARAPLGAAVRLRIVYIEDNQSNLKLMSRIVEASSGEELMSATNAASGVALVKEELPDLVLLDLHLPDVNGIAVLKTLRADPATAHIPVVVLSADATEGQVKRLVSAGAKSYLTKPIDLAVLFAEFEDVRRSLARES